MWHLQISELALTDISTIDQKIYFYLIIPTYQEHDNIKNIVRRLSQVLNGVIPGNYELMIVDDDSPVGTWEVV
jgi:dolichol-phosphate mannosyltransferase